MITKKRFSSVDGVTSRFLSDFIIQSEQFARVYIYFYNPAGVEGEIDPGTGLPTRVADFPNPSEDLINLDKWDLVDNSILFYTEPVAGSSVYLEVATTPEEFGDTLTAPSVERAETAASEAEASAAAALVSEINAAASEASINPTTLLHTVGTGAGNPEGYTTAEIDGELALKADQATTYTKTETDTEISTQISTKVVGFKNLLHNPNRTIQQRGTTGGRRQVIDASNIELGGSYVISHGGSATVRIYEATTLGTSDALTTWSELTAGASASGTVVTVTAGKYIKVEFSTTDFSFEQFEKGTIPSSFEQRAQLEPYLCLPYYEKRTAHRFYLGKTAQIETNANCSGTFNFLTKKRVAPSVSVSGVAGYTPAALDATEGEFAVLGTYTATNVGAYFTSFVANAEHFTDTYYEDRWF